MEELRKGLEKFSTSAGKRSPNVLALSLAPHIVSSKAEFIATVTFDYMPQDFARKGDEEILLQLGEEGKEGKEANHANLQVIVDRHFLGLTPLSCPAKPSVE